MKKYKYKGEKNSLYYIFCTLIGILIALIVIFLILLFSGKFVFSTYNDGYELSLEEKQELKEQMDRDKQALLDSYKTYSYEELIRKPKDYKGKKIAVTGTVVSVTDSNNGKMLILVETNDDSTHQFMITAYSDDSDERVWENDDITVYGIYQGVIGYTSTMGEHASFPSIKTDSIDIITKAEDKEESTESTESSIDIIIR